MLLTDPVDIAITLSSTFWKDPPKVKVYVNDNLIYNDEIVTKTDIKWNGELSEGTHKIAIELYDKDNHQTVLENDKIIKDQILNIDAISFDEIDIGYLKHTMSEYYPDKNLNAPLLVNDCVNLGWNGRWELEFTIPIYIWLLENI